MNIARLLRIAVLVLVVGMLGALGGWYMFIKKQVATTTSSDSARGLGIAPSFGSPLGGTFDNLSGATASSTTATQGAAAPRLWQVVKIPVAGFGFASSTSKLYFAERATGNILIADPAQSTIARLTNTLFPKTYEARFARNGSVVLRSVSENGVITSFAGLLSASTTSASEPQALLGIDLPASIVSLAVRPDTAQLFYLQRSSQGVVGKTTDWKGGSQKQVFASLLSEWQPLYLTDGSLYVTQNASDNVAGYAFKLVNGSAVPLVGPVAGLQILPKAGSSALLYSGSSGGGVGLVARASADSSFVTLPTRTVAEKCVWAPGESLIAYCAVPVSLSSQTFLRDWFSGQLHTTDVWWRVNVANGTADKFFTTDSTLSLDVRDPIMDASGSYIAFQNGSDGTLWMLRIAQ